MNTSYAHGMSTEYGKRLKLARKHAQLTQVALSKATGVPQSTIATAETLGNGSSETLIYARACGVDAMWLTNGDGDMLPQRPLHTTAMSEVQAPQAAALHLSPGAIKVAQVFDLMRDDLDSVEAVFTAQEAVMQSLRILRSQSTPATVPARSAKKQHA